MKLFLADDAALIRAGLTEILQRAGHEIVGHASSATELETRLSAALSAGEAIDVLITDVRMPPTMSDDGLRAAVSLRHSFPALGVMVLSQYVAPAYASALFAPNYPHELNAGAPRYGTVTRGGATQHSVAGAIAGDELPGGLGYLLKDRVAHVADFIRALTVVAAGGVVVDPEVAAGLMRAKSTVLSSLTPREHEVLELMAQGLSNSEIAGKLYLSGAAIAKHVANIFLKLGLAPGEENRRVRAVLAYLTATGGAGATSGLGN
ncbi:MAG: response regulator transcription factor [Arcanobacterium sp.]|nr:response regulator transcription factor [Arcanobacterium sp.]MDY5588562.1 response regulator transcription factor [Arcanobacterium sp.]